MNGGGIIGWVRKVVEGDGGVSLGEAVDVGRGGGGGKRAIWEENSDGESEGMAMKDELC